VGIAAVSPALAGDPGISEAFGQALQVDGIDDYVWCAPNASGLAQGTVEMWVRTDHLPATTAFWTGGNGHPGATGDWARLGTHVLTSGVSFGIFVGFSWTWAPSHQDQLAIGWSHVAGTWGPEGEKVYINGELAGTGSYTGGMSPYPIEIIGASAWGFSFEGAIDEVRVWKVARSEVEIQTAMGDTLDLAAHGGPGSDLVAYYRFDQFEDLGVGSDGADDVRDHSASANHADANGDPVLGPGTLPVEAVTWGRLKALHSGR
jgi:hypothetical protein